jgi:hypothetical protein
MRGYGAPVPRTVTLTVVDPDGRPLGELAPFEVPVPYWQEVAGIVTEARERFGIEVTILRIVTTGAGLESSDGGPVTYLAEAGTIPPGTPSFAGPATVDDRSPDHRAAYAQPGGPAATLRWAASALDEPVLRAEQQRTWNLSSIWRLQTRTGVFWLKEVPWFFAHEGATLRLVASWRPGLVPTLVAADGGRLLLADAPGEDLYGAGADIRDAIATDLHGLQVEAVDRIDDLLAIGVPDRRGSVLAERLAAHVAAYAPGDALLADYADDLPGIFAEAAACGLPDTLVHGDMHPGNVHGTGTGTGERVILDWGDSVVGHPAYDIATLTRGVSTPDADRLTAAWSARWRARVPGSDPDRALALLRPVVALRSAAIYADFLAGIEPAEHPYHAEDIPRWLAVTRRLLEAEPARA